MKHIFILFLSFFVFPAFAVTSESYVDSAVASLQDKIPAETTNTVLTNTGTAGLIGTRQIYDSSNDYLLQQNALVTAENFNTAMQNAIESEFVCIEWLGDVHDDEHCLLYKIRAATPQQILPDGYTPLEYIGTTGSQCIHTRKQLGANFEIYATVSVSYLGDNGGQFLGSTANNIDDFCVGIYSRTTLKSAISQNYTSGGIGYPGPGVKFTFGITPQQTVNYTGYTRSLVRPYRGNSSLVIGRPQSAYGTPAKFYSVQLYNNNVLDGNFVPAQRDVDGALGMYDTVSNTFFTNTCSGNFSAGSVIGSNLYLPSES